MVERLPLISFRPPFYVHLPLLSIIRAKMLVPTLSRPGFWHWEGGKQHHKKIRKLYPTKRASTKHTFLPFENTTTVCGIESEGIRFGKHSTPTRSGRNSKTINQYIIPRESKTNMTTVNTGAPPAPPMPYYDDDEMLDDYIDDDDFGGPPPPPPAPPTTTNASAPQTGNDEFGDDEDYWEAMMEFEGQRQQQQQQQQQQKEMTTATTTIASPTAVNDSSFDQTNDAPNPALGDEAMQETEIESALNTNTQNTNTVEEYLAARRQDNNLYNFER